MYTVGTDWVWYLMQRTYSLINDIVYVYCGHWLGSLIIKHRPLGARCHVSTGKCEDAWFLPCMNMHMEKESLVKDFEMYKFWHSVICCRYEMFNHLCSGIFWKVSWQVVFEPCFEKCLKHTWWKRRASCPGRWEQGYRCFLCFFFFLVKA